VSHPDLREVKHFELYCLPELRPFYEKWGFEADVGGIDLMRRAIWRQGSQIERT
jgi:hypothetical protein